MCSPTHRHSLSIRSPPVSLYLWAWLPVPFLFLQLQFCLVFYNSETHLCSSRTPPCRALVNFELRYHSRQLSFTAKPPLSFLISLCHAGSLTHSQCSFFALPLKHVMLCRSTPPSPTPPVAGQSRPS